jgi:hypothetical protein
VGAWSDRAEAIPDVTTYTLGSSLLPLFLEPTDPSLAEDTQLAVRWFEGCRDVLDAVTTEVGAIVLRGFAIHTSADFGELIRSYPADEVGYTGGAAPRKAIEGRVYEATRAPANLRICLHQEMAYMPAYPARLAFFCKTPAATGGETILGDMREVDAHFRDGFLESLTNRGVLYRRRFRSPDLAFDDPVIDALYRPWADAFGTSSPPEVEKLCAALGLEAEWLEDGNVLSVNYEASAFVRHPLTGDNVWFNQIAAQSLGPENYGEENFRRFTNAFAGGMPWFSAPAYGDGEAFADEDVRSIYPIYDRLTVSFPWSHGDVMLVDNLNVAHGRNPYSGPRDTQVALLYG